MFKKDKYKFPKYYYNDLVCYRGKVGRIFYITFDEVIGEVEYYIYLICDDQEVVTRESQIKPSTLKFKIDDLVMIPDDKRYFRVVDICDEFQEEQPMYVLEDLSGFTYIGVESDMQLIKEIKVQNTINLNKSKPTPQQKIQTNKQKKQQNLKFEDKINRDIQWNFEAWCITKEDLFLKKVKMYQKKLDKFKKGE